MITWKRRLSRSMNSDQIMISTESVDNPYCSSEKKMAPMPTSTAHSSHALNYESQMPHGSTSTHVNSSNLATVELPRIEPQPWVKGLIGWLSENTAGVARVDLRRPT